MDNIKNDQYYVDKVIIEIEFLIKHTEDISKKEFWSTEYAVMPTTLLTTLLDCDILPLRWFVWKLIN
jgi:hypothetical protein